MPIGGCRARGIASGVVGKLSLLCWVGRMKITRMTLATPQQDRRRDTTWQMPWWLGHRAWAVVWAGLLAYGSLIPFDFGPLTWEAFFTAPRWHNDGGGVSSQGMPSWLSDLLANLVLYAPLGFLLVFDAPRRWRWPWTWLRAVLVVVAMSWVIECTQNVSPSRYAAMQDFLANALSGLIGATLGVMHRGRVGGVFFWLYIRFSRLRYAWDDLKQDMHRRPGWTVAMSVLIIGLLCLRMWQTATARELLDGSLPFVDAFQASYDVSGVRLLLIAMGYGLLAMAIAAPIAGLRARRPFAMGMLIVACVALLIEIVFFWKGESFGTTGPMIAVFMAGLLTTFAALGRRAVRHRDRRQQAQPVAVERRRRTWGYR